MPLDLLPLCISLLIVGGLFLVIARMGRAGTLERNGIIGIRTRATLQSDAAWYAGHRAIAPTLRACAYAQFLGAVVVLALGLITNEPLPGILTGLAFLIGSTLVMVTAAVTTAARAAHQAHEERQKEQAKN